jgi:hypothetical protein
MNLKHRIRAVDRKNFRKNVNFRENEIIQNFVKIHKISHFRVSEKSIFVSVLAVEDSGWTLDFPLDIFFFSGNILTETVLITQANVRRGLIAAALVALVFIVYGLIER